MGLKYCKPVKQTPAELSVLQSLTLLDIRNKLAAFLKATDKKGLYFIANEELKTTFNLSKIQLYHCLDIFSVHRDVRRVNGLDFWCAVALASSGPSEEKISFCVKLIDGNNDNYISYHELIVLLLCATRGIANLKGLMLIPEDIIDIHAIKVFTQYQKTLNSEGDIALVDLVEYLLTNDQCRSYLVALGAKIPPIDAAAIVLKRSNILREIALVRFQAEEIINEIDELQEQGYMFEHRDGDMELLRLDTTGFPTMPIQLTTSIPTLQMQIQHREEIDITKEEEMRTNLDSKHPVNKYFQFDDSWMAEIYQNARFEQQQFQLKQRQLQAANKSRPNTRMSMSMTSPSSPLAGTRNSMQLSTAGGQQVSTAANSGIQQHNIYGKGFENALLKEWRKIPQLRDKMIRIDPFTMMAIFEEVNISLTYTQAKECLAAAPKNQLAQVCFDNVLYWFRLHYAEIQYAQEQLQRRLISLDPNDSPVLGSNAVSPTGSFRIFQQLDVNGVPSLPKEVVMRHDYETWQYFVQQGKARLDKFYDSVKSVWNRLQLQRHIMSDWKEDETNLAKKITDFRQNSNKKTSSIILSYDVNHRKILFQHHAKSYPLLKNVTGVFSYPMKFNPLATNQTKPKTPTANSSPSRGRTPMTPSRSDRLGKEKIVNPLENIEYKSNLRLFWTTNPHTNLSTKRPKDMSRIKLMIKQDEEELRKEKEAKEKAAAEAAAKEAEEAEYRRYGLSSDNPPPEEKKEAEKGVTKEENKEESKAEDESKGYEIVHIQDHDNLQASDVLDFVNLICEKLYLDQLYGNNTTTQKRFSKLTLPLSITNPQGTNSNNTETNDNSEENKTDSDTTNKNAETLPEPPQMKFSSPKEFKSAAWFVIDMKKETSQAHTLLLRQCLEDFLNLIPLELRFNLFTTVYVQVCSIDAPIVEAKIDLTAANDSIDNTVGGALSGKSSKLTLAQIMKQNLQRLQEQETAKAFENDPNVILVALLHEDDHFYSAEQSVLTQLSMFLTRIVFSGQLDIACTEKLSTLFQQLLPFTQLDSLLYGPQEEELEECSFINPLKFMKEMKATKTAYREMLENLSNMTREELINICVQYGMKSTGSFKELSSRCEKILRCKFELCGHYELSRTSKQIIYELVYYLKYSLPKLSQSLIHQTNLSSELTSSNRDGSTSPSRGGAGSPGKKSTNESSKSNNPATSSTTGIHPSNVGFNFWEFNGFLHSIQLPTLYQKEQFEAFVNDYELLLTKNSEVTISSIFLFYEKFGSLLQEREQWKIGCLDSLFVGKLNLQLYYDSYALNSFLKLYTSTHYGTVTHHVEPKKKKEDLEADDDEDGSITQKSSKFMSKTMSKSMDTMNTMTTNATSTTAGTSKPSLFSISNSLVSKAQNEKDEEKFIATTTVTTNLVGQHYDMMLNIPPFIRYLLRYTNIKEIKTDKYVEKLSDVLNELQIPWEELGFGNIQKALRQLLQSPGGCVEWINDLIAIWNNGEEGILPMLRRFLKTGISEAQALRRKSSIGGSEDDMQPKSKKKGRKTVNGSSRSPNRSSSPSKSNRSDSINGDDDNLSDADDMEIHSFTDPDGDHEEEEEKEGAFNPMMEDDGRSVGTADSYDSASSQKHDRDRKLFDKFFDEKFMHEVKKQLNEAMEEEEQKRLEMEQLEEAQLQAELAGGGGESNEQHSSSRPVSPSSPHHTTTNSTSSTTPHILRSRKQIEYETIQKVVKLFVPAMTKKMRDKNWQQVKEEIINDLIFLNYVKTFNPNFELTYEESVQVEAQKAFLNRQLKIALELEHKNYQQLTIYVIMLYDLCKLTSKCVTQVGWGTKDVCIGGNIISGWEDFWDCLPWGKTAAEIPPLPTYFKSKYDRFHERKLNALAALEREKLRRNLTDEDRERIRLEKLLQQKEVFFQEEIKVYGEIMQKYYELKESKELGHYLSRENITKFITSYENLLKMKESRFPNDIYTQVIRNNVAVVLYDFYGMDHPSSEPVPYLLKEGSEKIIELGYEDQIPPANAAIPPTPTNSISASHFPAHEAHLHNDSTVMSISIDIDGGGRGHTISGNDSVISNITSDPPVPAAAVPLTNTTKAIPFTTTVSSADSVVSETSQSQYGKDTIGNTTISTNYPQGIRTIISPACKAMIIVNYIILLQLIEDFSLLRQTIPLKLFCLACWKQLTIREQEKFLLGVLPDIQGMNVLVLQKGQLASTMQGIVKEAEYYVKQQQRGSVQGYYANNGNTTTEAVLEDMEEGKVGVMGEEDDRLIKDKQTAAVGAGVAEGSVGMLDDESLSSAATLAGPNVKQSKKLSQKEKAEKYAEQRRKDNALRQQVSRQRKLLYDLIQTDEISKIFEAKASQVGSGTKPVWGDANNQEIAEKQDEFNSIAAGMADHKYETTEPSKKQ